MEDFVADSARQLAAASDPGLPQNRNRRADLETLLRSYETVPDLLDADLFQHRIEVIDRLELLPDRDDDSGFVQRVRNLQSRLEGANAALFVAIRQSIRSGDGQAALAPWLLSSVAVNAEIAPGLGYDWRDDLVAGILELAEPDGPLDHPGDEMVFYQPTPARHLFDLLRMVKFGPNEVLVDLGSGLGHVPLLASIATPAHCIGIEREPSYAACARQCAVELRLEQVTFVEGDVREADLSAGTVFYLYTPFTGSILEDVLARLRREAEKRSIRVATFGPCTSVVAREPWLAATTIASRDRITLFISRLRKP